MPLTRQALLTPVPDRAIANFCDGIQVRVSPAVGIRWADQPTMADRIGAFIDSDLGARVFTAAIVFSLSAMVVLSMAAVQTARGF